MDKTTLTLLEHLERKLHLLELAAIGVAELHDCELPFFDEIAALRDEVRAVLALERGLHDSAVDERIQKIAADFLATRPIGDAR